MSQTYLDDNHEVLIDMPAQNRRQIRSVTLVSIRFFSSGIILSVISAIVSLFLGRPCALIDQIRLVRICSNLQVVEIAIRPFLANIMAGKAQPGRDFDLLVWRKLRIPSALVVEYG